MPLKIIICDDSPQALQILQHQVHLFSQRHHFAITLELFTNGNDILQLLQKDKNFCDILLLDVDMPDISGLEIARLIREKNRNIILIFVSAHEEYVFQSIEYQPFRYIRKYLVEEELPVALKSAVSIISKHQKHSLYIKSDGQDLCVYQDDIMYCEMENRKMAIHLNNGEQYLIWKTIKNLQTELSNTDFILINSGCIVHIPYILAFSINDITLKSGKKLLVSRRRRNDIKKSLMNYWRENI